jgi:formiminotetrahydrofolate cyclodeaminase
MSVRDFVGAVAAAERPVPAGGSVAALTGAASAALLALVCGVLQRRQPGVLSDQLETAGRLQQHLLELVDEDAAAFRAFLAARRSGVGLLEAIARTASAPLKIGSACAEVIVLSDTVEADTAGPMLGDVRAARYLAAAAVQTALALAEQNLDLQPDAEARQALEAEISRLRAQRPNR